MSEHYDGTKLLSLKDKYGKIPEVYICTTNRTGGKTTFFNRWRLNLFKKRKQKTIWYFRFQSELENAAESIFKGQRDLFFPRLTYRQDLQMKGKYADLYVDDKHIGYAIALNSADGIKKYSSIFYDASGIIFDEFQPETNRYCANEFIKFQSLHTSLARGGGKSVRYLPIYMLSNAVTLLNPYYVSLGLSATLRQRDKFVRGNGFVLEQGYVKSAADAMMNSAFNRAFGGNDYLLYATQNKYLLDNMDMITKYKGKKNYFATIKDKKKFSVQFINNYKSVYFCREVDENFPVKVATKAEFLENGYTFKKSNPTLIVSLRKYFNQGDCCFDSLEAKEACFNLLSY